MNKGFDYKKRKYIRVEIKPNPQTGNRETLKAELMEGEVLGCTPIGLEEMNQDIDSCISFLKRVKEEKDESSKILS